MSMEPKALRWNLHYSAVLNCSLHYSWKYLWILDLGEDFKKTHPHTFSGAASSILNSLLNIVVSSTDFIVKPMFVSNLVLYQPCGLFKVVSCAQPRCLMARRTGVACFSSQVCSRCRRGAHSTQRLAHRKYSTDTRLVLSLFVLKQYSVFFGNSL